MAQAIERDWYSLIVNSPTVQNERTLGGQDKKILELIKAKRSGLPAEEIIYDAKFSETPYYSPEAKKELDKLRETRENNRQLRLEQLRRQAETRIVSGPFEYLVPREGFEPSRV